MTTLSKTGRHIPEWLKIKMSNAQPKKRDHDKNILTQLYYSENKRLQEIATQYGVSRERVRQWMESLGIPRTRRRKYKTKAFRSLEKYFKAVQNGMKEKRYMLLKFILPLKKQCQECPSTKNLHIHHLKYPAISAKDIQILCCSCHIAKHKKGNHYKIQLEICNKYVKGKNGIELAEEYNCHESLIYHILHRWNIKTRPRFYRKVNKNR